MSKHKSKQEPPESSDLRIIGGRFRGSKLIYALLENEGKQVTRPMKERVRESLFNLVSTQCGGKHAIDLFAGTGALGLEALSRGAQRVTFIEKHIPTARVVEENIAALNVESQSELLMTSAFLWGKRDLPQQEFENPLLVFCSPPYAFFVDRHDEMLTLISAIIDRCPADSVVLVEADERFDFASLPGGVRTEKRGPGWDVRTYSPAVVGVWRT